MRTFKKWVFDQINRLGERREEGLHEPVEFTAEVVGTAQKLKVERDTLYPGYWHVIEPYGPKKGQYLEFRVQTDEWIENGSVDWALCNCPEGKDTTSQVSHCAHVAAVLLAMVEELNR
jgi:hypothetical protein